MNNLRNFKIFWRNVILLILITDLFIIGMEVFSKLNSTEPKCPRCETVSEEVLTALGFSPPTLKDRVRNAILERRSEIFFIIIVSDIFIVLIALVTFISARLVIPK